MPALSVYEMDPRSVSKRAAKDFNPSTKFYQPNLPGKFLCMLQKGEQQKQIKEKKIGEGEKKILACVFSPGVNFINCFPPNSYLLHPTPNFSAEAFLWRKRYGVGHRRKTGHEVDPWLI